MQHFNEANKTVDQVNPIQSKSGALAHDLRRIGAILPVAAGVLLYAVPVLAHAAGTGLGGVFTTLGTQAGVVPAAMEKVGYAAGATFGVLGMLNFRKHQDPEAKKKGAIEAAVAAALFGFGYWMQTIAQTYGGSGSTAKSVLGR